MFKIPNLAGGILPDSAAPRPTGRYAGGVTVRWLILTLLGVQIAAFGGTTNSWRVFRPLTGTNITVGPNRVSNGTMESASGSTLTGWAAYGAGYKPSTNVAHAGLRSLQCVSSNSTEIHGGSQTLVLNQTTAKAIKLSGWSKAQGVTGVKDADYSVYLDLTYADGSPLWGQTISFSVGSHDWEYQERWIIPAQPIKQLSCYLLFRNSHAGTVWFDDVAIAEAPDGTLQFDGEPVAFAAPSPLPYDSGTRLTLLTGDGLRLEVAQDGGAIEGVWDGTNSLQAAGFDFASGWFIRDRTGNSDGWNVGGSVSSTNGGLLQQGVLTNLGLAASITYTPTNNAIRIQATVSNLMTSDRALSLYFALPVTMDNAVWWNSPRESVPVNRTSENATLGEVDFGARNLLSSYPVATLSGSSALSLALPPDQYRPFRLAYNGASRQFFAVFDVGISSIPINFPQTVTAEIWLYRSDAAWGLRSGLAGLYRLFPKAYTERAFTNEGIWVAFADIHGITNISDFGVGYHEIGYSAATVKSDDALGIPSFRYVSEPWSYWMTMPTNLSNTTYSPVYNYLLTKYSQGVAAATATLSSGLRDAGGNLQYFPAAEPWCPYGAAFYLNPSPFISDPQFSVTKFNSEWNATVRDVYNHPENGQLDGEYIDSFCSAAAQPDYSVNHMRTTSFPLTYTRDNLALMTPLIFGSYEMARAISADVHALGKPMIANTVYMSWPSLPLGMGVFDFAGTEVNWFDAAGNFVRPADSLLLYSRALSGKHPYGFLLNTDFSKVTHDEVEAYMQLCACYAIYPSAFSANAATGNYFETPALYERDRSLFKKYVPIIRALSLAGWEPVTDATADSASVALESYGTNALSAARYLTVRNLSSVAATANITFDMARWANRGAQWIALTNLFDNTGLLINAAAGSNSVSLTLLPNECRVYAVQSSPATHPTVRLDDGAFGVRSNEFGFNVNALSGQTVVIEASANMVDWKPVRTNLISDAGTFFFAEANSLSLRFYRARLQ